LRPEALIEVSQALSNNLQDFNELMLSSIVIFLI
jgi:hypothetical protein